jgi:hypothetical protein
MAVEKRRRGAPPKPVNLVKRRVLQVRLTDDTWEWLADVAKRHETDTSDMARRLILRGLSEEGNPPGGPWVSMQVDLPE